MQSSALSAKHCPMMKLQQANPHPADYPADCLHIQKHGLPANFNCGTHLQEHSPVLGQAGSRERTNQEGKRVAALKRLWLSKITASSTLSLVTRVLRLLYNLMDTIIGNQTSFHQRTRLLNSALPTADHNSGMAATLLVVACWQTTNVVRLPCMQSGHDRMKFM